MRVMVFGVFDLLHPGHIDFLRQAKELGDKLVVSVARDQNVKRVKGSPPQQNEQARIKAISKLGWVDKVVLGGDNEPMGHIKIQQPDIIALGYDQREYIDNLSEALQKAGLSTQIVRLKPFYAEKYKTSKLKKNGNKV